MLAFVTGASAGFGSALTHLLAKNGHRVIASGRRLDRLQALERQYKDRVFALQLDVRDRQAVETAVAALPVAWREIDVLVNNAGLALGLDGAHKASFEDWDIMVDTNIKGVLHCTHALLPGFVARNRGHIVNLGSIAGETPYPNGNVYGATKAFVHHLSLNLRADLLGTAVRVTCVEPGMAETEFSEVRFKGDRARASAVYKGVTPLSSEDIAETIYWVLTRPAHVNINVISLMPTQQAFGPFAISRT